MKTWQLQKAKSQFSEVFELTLKKGPQKVTRRGKDAVVIISERVYCALIQKEHFVDCYKRFSGSPDLILNRSEELRRDY